jgi:hypothetical protein
MQLEWVLGQSEFERFISVVISGADESLHAEQRSNPRLAL